MNSHLSQGIAAKVVSQLLAYCLSTDITDEILRECYTTHEAAQIKQEIQAIAEQQRQSAVHHLNILKALEEPIP